MSVARPREESPGGCGGESAASLTVGQRRGARFILASTVADPRRVLFADNATPPDPEPPDMSRPIAFYWTEGRSGSGLTTPTPPRRSSRDPISAFRAHRRSFSRRAASSHHQSRSPNVFRDSPQNGPRHCGAAPRGTAGA